jgi:hypothetical protein
LNFWRDLATKPWKRSIITAQQCEPFRCVTLASLIPLWRLNSGVSWVKSQAKKEEDSHG